MKLIVVRHGSTELNEQNALRGWLDVPLSGIGQRQASNLAMHFAHRRIDRIYTSDLQRASDTATAIAQAHNQVAEMGQNPLLGMDPRSADEMARAKASDLVTFPEIVRGATCGNCRFLNHATLLCEHKEVAQYVAPDTQCCSRWDKSGTRRPWEDGIIVFQPGKRVESEWTQLLRPINFGDLQGRPYPEIQDQMADLMRVWETKPYTKAPGGESFSDFQDRLMLLMETIIRDNQGEDDHIILTTHVRVCLWLAAFVFNGGRALQGEQLRLLDGSEVETGNFMKIETSPRLRMTMLNSLRQQRAPDVVPPPAQS